MIPNCWQRIGIINSNTSRNKAFNTNISSGLELKARGREREKDCGACKNTSFPLEENDKFIFQARTL